MIAAAAGARVIAVDIDDAKLARARARRRARRAEDAVAAIRELTGGGAHVSLDALGSAGDVHELDRAACASAAATCRSGSCSATIASVAMPMARVIAHELRVFGVHGMAVRHYDGMLRAIACGSVRPGRAGGEDDRAGRGGRRARLDGSVRAGGRHGRRALAAPLRRGQRQHERRVA